MAEQPDQEGLRYRVATLQQISEDRLIEMMRRVMRLEAYTALLIEERDQARDEVASLRAQLDSSNPRTIDAAEGGDE